MVKAVFVLCNLKRRDSALSLWKIGIYVRIAGEIDEMARIAIISDIHANYHALCAVIEDVRAMQCGELVCLGDVVGYNAFPTECLDYIRQLDCPVVRGNHDEEVVTPNPTKMNDIARQAMNWTRAQLSGDRRDWLARLQYQRIVRTSSGHSISIVHSSLDHPKNWNYIINTNDAASNFPRQFCPLCFHGHTHVPKVFLNDGQHTIEDFERQQEILTQGYTEIQPLQGIKYFINVGSVGQPRDGDPRACYGIYDTDLNLVIIKRVAYDVQAAQQAVQAVGLPQYLADRLGSGT